MNKLFWKKLLDESNLLIFIPAVFIVASFVMFLVFGLSDPSTSEVYDSLSIVESQKTVETRLLLEGYNTDIYTKDNPYFILNPYGIAPLSGLLSFTTSENSQFKIVIRGKTDEGNIEYISSSSTLHSIPIYGFYPETRNTVEIYELEGIDTYTLVHSFYVDTDALPNSIILPESVETTFDYFGTDIMITMSTSSNLPVGYDYLGDVRWYLSEEVSWSPKQLENGHFLFGYRDLVDPYYSNGLIEIDFLGKVYAQYKISGGYHHDYFEMPNGNLLVGTNDFTQSLEDIVVEIDRTTGTIIKTINIADYINMLDGPSEMWTLTDWFHMNSIYYDEITDSIILSGKNQDIVISIGYSSNVLNWVIGDPVNWDTEFVDEYFFTPVGLDFEWQYAQSSVTVLDNGDIFMFDNGINKSKLRENDILVESTYSRGVIYSIDTDLMNIEQVFEYGKSLGTTFYSPLNSNVKYYDVDSYLIHSGGQATINGEIAKLPNFDIEDSDVVEYSSTTIEIENGLETYKMVINDEIYHSYKASLYNTSNNFVASVGLSLGSQIETERYTIIIPTGFNLFKNVPSDYDLKFEKEFDRLVVKGNFDEGEPIYIILLQGKERIQYLVPTVDNAYSVVCLDVCHDGSVDITFYINEEGLSGKYDIIVIINGKEYDTYKTVIFE